MLCIPDRALSPRHSALYLSLLLAATGAHAQEASNTEGTKVDAKELDTVLVEGERLQLNLEQDTGLGALGSKRLLDTPFSVTVADREDIAKRQATTLGQVFINDPSVYAAEPSASTNWWGTQIRGIGVQNHYVDGVPMLMEWGGQFPLETVESVQALKGLGGFMYGFGSPGGIISYQTKQPTESTLFATTVGYRNESVFSAQVDAGGRFNGPGSTGYRVNAAIEKGDAYNGAGIDRKVFALTVNQSIGDSLTLRAGITYEDSTLKHEPLYFYWDSYEGDRLPKPMYDYANVRVGNSSYKSETLHTTAGLEWRINDAWKADLTLGESRREHYSDKMFANLLNEEGDYAGYVYDFAAVLRSEVAQLVVSGNATTGPVEHDLVFGASQQRTTDQWSNEFYYSNDFDGNLYQRQTFLSTRTPDFSLSPVSSDLRQKAVFASDTLRFGEHWQAILGARYVDYEQRDLDGDPETDRRYATATITPTMALIYKPIDDLSIYGSYVESLEPGSRVGTDASPPYANAGEILDPTISKQHELGAKYQMGRVGITAAAFRIERAATIDQLRDGLRYLAQDGLTLYRGAEVIGSVGVTSDLDVGLGVLWLDPSLEELSPENSELSGNRPAGAARRQFVANLEYRPPFMGGLSLHGNIRYSGDQYYEDANRVLVPGRTVTNVGMQYRTLLGGRTATVTANINNLFNRKYWNLDTLGEARNGSIDLRIDW